MKFKNTGFFVSEILGGEYWIHKNASIYFSNFYDEQNWFKALEWLVLENEVKVINHSYSSNTEKEQYNDQAFYLDYLSRKYGVINVFSSGNGESNPFYKNKWINNMSLSFNSIIVVALNDTNDSVSSYSNWRINSNYKIFLNLLF
ncbi:S8 family serine peptidase [Mycoplasmopsis felis]|uniref:S8 family serine peptidase n=1 Tax=Mycoplasmopsis felis TaxID=33923 RepID=UPI003AF3B7C8